MNFEERPVLGQDSAGGKELIESPMGNTLLPVQRFLLW